MSFRTSGVIAFTFLIAFSVSARDMMLTLHWQPGDDIAGFEYVDVGKLSKLRVQIGPIQDSRTKQEIGANTENEGRPRRYITKDNVAEWSSGRLQYIMKYFNVNIVKDNPDIVISPELTQFYVSESSVYKGQVVFKITVTNRSGEELWSGIAKDDSHRWGRSMSDENYFECICNAFLGSIYKLLKNQEFISAVSK